MKSEYPEKSLMWHLKRVRDPRRREGLVYPIWGLLGMLVLGGINGQKTLRSMWLWGAMRWERISRPLGFSGQARPPSYGTIWYALKNLEVGQLEGETREWASQLNQAESEGWSADGKVMRGSRRDDPHQAAVQVVTMVAQTLKRVMGQQIAEGGDQSEATIQLLKAVPLEGKLVTLDAGLLHRETANTIIEQGGNYLGPLKGNQAEVKKAVDEWIDAKISPLGRPDTEQ